MNVLTSDEIRDRVHTIIDELYEDRKNLQWALNWHDLAVISVIGNTVTICEASPEEKDFKEGIEKIYSMKYNEKIKVLTQW